MYPQTMRCFPPALSALWDHELRGAGASGPWGHNFPCEWVSACRTAGSCSQCGGWDSPGRVQGRQQGPRALMVQASHKTPPILPISSHSAPVTHGDWRHKRLKERGQRMGAHRGNAESSCSPMHPALGSSHSQAGRAKPVERESIPAGPAGSKRASLALPCRAPQAAPSSPEIRGCSPHPAGC